MSEPEFYFGGIPTGRKLESPAPAGVSRFHVLAQATDEAVEVCRRYWPQADPDDFDWDGKRARDLASGEVYRVSTSYPFAGSPDPAVICFVIRDNRIVPLRRRGEEVVTEVVEYGRVSGSRATGRERRDVLGPVIR